MESNSRMPTEQLEVAVPERLDRPECLEDVLRAFGPAVRAVLTRKYYGVLSYDDIEDVLATGLYRLWASRDRFDPDVGSLKAWFFRIVDNCARDVLKYGWQKARQLEVSSDQLLKTAASPSDPTDDGERTRRSDIDESTVYALREILDSLPDAQRKIVLADSLAKDETASSEFLADELGLSASTVRVYRKRALERIRREMKERGIEA